MSPPEAGYVRRREAGSPREILSFWFYAVHGRIARHRGRRRPLATLLADGAVQRHPARAYAHAREESAVQTGFRPLPRHWRFSRPGKASMGLPGNKSRKIRCPPAEDEPAQQETGMKLTPTALALCLLRQRRIRGRPQLAQYGLRCAEATAELAAQAHGQTGQRSEGSQCFECCAQGDRRPADRGQRQGHGGNPGGRWPRRRPRPRPRTIISRSPSCSSRRQSTQTTIRPS